MEEHSTEPSLCEGTCTSLHHLRMHAATLLGYGAKGFVQSEMHIPYAPHQEIRFQKTSTWHPQNLEQVSGVGIATINSLSIT